MLKHKGFLHSWVYGYTLKLKYGSISTKAENVLQYVVNGNGYYRLGCSYGDNQGRAKFPPTLSTLQPLYKNRVMTSLQQFWPSQFTQKVQTTLEVLGGDF